MQAMILVYLRLAAVLLLAGAAILLISSAASAGEIKKVAYSAAFPKPIGTPAKGKVPDAKPTEFVWIIASIYRDVPDKPEVCKFVDGESGRISVLRTVQNPADPTEYAWVGTDVRGDEAAAEACMVAIEPAKLKNEGRYAHQ